MAQYFSASDVRTHFDKSVELLSDPPARLIYQMSGMRRKFSVYSSTSETVTATDSCSILTVMLLVAYYEHIFTSLFQSPVSQPEVHGPFSHI